MADTKEENGRVSLAFQGLTEIPTKVLRTKTVRELDLTHNRITEFKFMLDLPYLESLVLDHNYIESHTKFPHSTRLSTLWVNHNNITNLSVFVSTISQCFPNLQYLSMMNNEAAPSFFNGGSFPQYLDYRHFVISQLPNLEILDHTSVTKTERREAHRIYGRFKPRGRKANMVLETTLDSYKSQVDSKKKKRRKKETPEAQSNIPASTEVNGESLQNSEVDNTVKGQVQEEILPSEDCLLKSSNSQSKDDMGSSSSVSSFDSTESDVFPESPSTETHGTAARSLPIDPTLRKLGSNQIPEMLPDVFTLDGVPDLLPEIHELPGGEKIQHATCSTAKTLSQLPDLPEF